MYGQETQKEESSCASKAECMTEKIYWETSINVSFAATKIAWNTHNCVTLRLTHLENPKRTQLPYSSSKALGVDDGR